MSEHWINQSENILKTLKKIASKKERDRLEILNTMIFTINALDRSVLGWKQWIQDLGFMSRFTMDELREIEEGLMKTVQNFIENDIDVTKRHENKITRIRLSEPKQKKREDSRGIYS